MGKSTDLALQDYTMIMIWEHLRLHNNLVRSQKEKALKKLCRVFVSCIGFPLTMIGPKNCWASFQDIKLNY